MAEKRNISLVLTAVDGTLVTEEKVLTKRAQSAVRALQDAGIRFAMGNASDEVKAQAAAITDSYNDEGFAKAMERFVLGSMRERAP